MAIGLVMDKMLYRRVTSLVIVHTPVHFLPRVIIYFFELIVVHSI